MVVSPFTAAAEPDFTAPDVIGNFKKPGGSDQYGVRQYKETYNLGVTGIRGWIYNGNEKADTKGLELSTDLSRKILVTVVGHGSPAAGKLQIDDVILGVSWGSDSSLVSDFSSDARKSLAKALTEAEKAENGHLLKIKYWRAGVVTQVTLKLDEKI